MKRLFTFLFCSLVIFACSKKGESHIEFLSVPIDGTVSEYLNRIQTESSSTKGCFSDNLGFTVDTVNFEKELFGCGNHESLESPTFLWIEYEVFWNETTKMVCYLEGKAIIGWKSLDVLKIKLFESLGQATYTGNTLDEKTKNSWDEIEKSLFQNMTENFIAWDCGNGYVIIDYEGPDESKWEDAGFFVMYIVDRKNYWEGYQTF